MTEKLDPKQVAMWRKQIPLRRGGNTDDVAEAAMYLGSDLAGYVTGQVLQVDGEPISRSGTFKILEFNVEQQFLNADVTKLQQVAANTNGNSYFIDNTEELINDLLNDNRYKTIQKSNKNTVPLIDFKFLLFLIALSLTIEWFLRKYNGLI